MIPSIRDLDSEQADNPVGLDGIEFIEFTSGDPVKLELLFLEFGFSKLKRHHSRDISYFNQNDIHLLLNNEPRSVAREFGALHGPSISAMGWRVHDADEAARIAVKRGAQRSAKSDYADASGYPIPAIVGIGGSLIYLIENAINPRRYEGMGFRDLGNPARIVDKGFTAIDHLTNSVEKGKVAKWADFYKNVFGFTEVSYFDIRDAKTGVTSYALRSPCGRFCIPINEYLREYRGPGIHHLAFLTEDIVASLHALEGSSIETLNGDEHGYPPQIFTKNLIGPIFIEIIQRKNHLAGGEGKFSAVKVEVP